VSFTADAPKLTAESSSTPPSGASSAVAQTMSGLHYSLTGKATADGVESGSLTHSWSGMSQKISVTMPAKEGAPAAPPMKIDVAIGAGTGESKFDGTRNRALMALWGWLLAHPTKEAKVAAQAEFKQIARAALPLFDKINGVGSIKSVAATTQLGVFSAQDVTIGVNLAGAVESGSFGEKIALKNFAMPAGLAPAWARDLTPRDIAFEFNVSGFNLAATANAIIDGLDFSATPPLSKEVSDSLQKKLLTSRGVDISIPDIHLANATYDISMNAKITAGPGQVPSGTGTIRAKGLDAIAQALNEAAKTDKNAMSAVGGLAMARALAKPGPDGTSVWEIAFESPGKLTVNGKALGGAPQK